MLTRLRQRGLMEAVERLTGLTGAGVLALLATGGAVLLGRRLDSAGLTILGYALGIALVSVWVLSRRRVHVSAERTDLPHRVTLGRVIDTELTLTSASRLTSVVVEEEFPQSLGQRVRLGVPVLPAGAPVTHGYQFRADRRGHYQVGPLTLERTDPFGLARSRQQLAEPTALIVHPRTEPVLDRILKRQFEDPILRPPHSKPWPTGSEFYGMRPYEYGDDPRRIVWRAVARHQDLLVREAEHGITDQVCLMLDSCRSSYSFPGGDSESFERAVSAAASVGSHHLANGFSLTLRTNGEELGLRMRGKHERLDLLDALAAVEPERATLADTVHRLLLDRAGDAHHVVITGQLTAATAASLRAFTERGRSLVVILVLDFETDPMTITHALSLRCPIIEVLAGESLQKPLQAALGVRPR